MKLYQTPGGVWASTIDDWKSAMKAEGAVGTLKELTVNVPTDKLGLLEFLTFHGVNTLHPCGTTIVSHVVQNMEPPKEPPETTIRSLTLDEMFEQAPLGQRLTLAQLALEDAYRIVKEKSNAPQI